MWNIPTRTLARKNESQVNDLDMKDTFEEQRVCKMVPKIKNCTNVVPSMS